MNTLKPADEQIDIRTVDPSALADIRDIEIDPGLPFAQRAEAFVKQCRGSTRCFRCGEMVVKITHSENGTTMSDCIEGFLRSLR